MMAMNKKVAQAVEVELKVQNPKDVLPATQVRYSGGILRLEQKVLLSQFRYIYILIYYSLRIIVSSCRALAMSPLRFAAVADFLLCRYSMTKPLRIRRRHDI